MGNCLAADGPHNSTANNISRLFRTSNLHNGNNGHNHTNNNNHHHHHHSHLSMSTNDIDNPTHLLNGLSNGGGRANVQDLLTGGDIRSSSGHLNSTNFIHDPAFLVSKNLENQMISDNKSSLNNLVSNNNSKSQQQIVASTNGININNNNNNGNKNSTSQQRIMICLNDFVARDDGELSVRRGDRLMVTDTNHPDWCFVEHITNKRSGFVPKSYVTSEPFEMEEWFFSKINRREAEKLLLAPNNCRGTFLIRNSEQAHTGYSLSIRDEDQSKGIHVKHYRIKTLDNGGYFVATKNTFRTLPELISFYSKDKNGLCYRLISPCPKKKRETYWPCRGDEIIRSELTFIRKIGAGCFGEVFYGSYMNNYEVAIKTLKQGTMSAQAFLEEAVIMRKCRHKNLVPLLGVCSQEEPLLIITQYMCNGSLLEYLRNNQEGKNLKLPDLIVMAHEIASGMEYLEKVKLVHRDLAARNILVDEDRSCKVADFGLARVVEDTEYTARQGTKFPIKWSSPESVSRGLFSSKSDCWSFGVCLYEIITYGCVPYPSLSNSEVIAKVEKGYRMPCPQDCPPKLYQIMLECWHKDPEKRPTFETLKWKLDEFFETEPSEYKDASQNNL